MSTLKTTQIAHPSSASNNIVLNSDGSATIADLTATTIQGTIKSGTAVASTSGTAIDFTGLPSWVKRITVMFNGVSTNGSSPPQVQIGSGSVATSGYSGSNSLIVSSAVTANFTTGFGIGVNTTNWGSTSVTSGLLVMCLVGSNIWAAAGTFGDSNFTVTRTTASSVAISGTLDRIRITTVNGTDTFDAGTINILYEG